ncbi:MAG: NUDIX domain-containing protein [Acidobacteria bacterium]|nr:NUDIX domain-containing protein [Acidobacteriota bacterium]MBV9481968.1 NUDIX domain-containing protein [Acidobacteriota bacterium]
MLREFSAGGVVVRPLSGRWVLAAIAPHRDSPQANSSAKKKSPSSPLLALPKGLVDPGEDPCQAAVREVREETGLTANLITKLRDIKYFYVRSWGDGERVFKIVSFYLLQYGSGEIDDISPEMRIEVARAMWLPLEEGHTRLTYRSEREVVRLAAEYVKSHPELAHGADLGEPTAGLKSPPAMT